MNMKINTLLFRIFLPLLIVPLLFNTAKATPINITTTNTNEACNGGNTATATATVTGGNTPYTYAWSTTPSQTTATATGLTAGTYTIGVVDAAFNTASAVVTVTQPAVFNVTANIMSYVLCNGQNNGGLSAIPSGGTSPFVYVWHPSGSTSDTVTGMSAGCYTVTAADACGATATATTCITQPNILAASIHLNGIIRCNGGAGGLACSPFGLGGTPPYTYLWSNGSTDSTATGLIAGTYSLLLTDNNGCTSSATYTLTQPAVLIDTLSSINNTSCVSPNGEAMASTYGGTSPYYYMWAPINNTYNPATGLTPGTYTCTVYDAYGCSTTSAVTVGGTPAPLLTVSSTDDTNHHCMGSVTASATGGTTPYTYLWSPGGATTANVTGLCTGSYCCTITDANGCTDYDCIAVNDTLIPCAHNNYNQQICIVTLDTATNKCEIIWGRNNAPPAGGYGTFNIYRDTGAGYSFIHSQALNVLSEYIDSGSNPSAGAVSYELATYDSCGLSAYSSPHTSIYLTTTAGINAYTLNWTAYVGFTPTQYIIYRGPSLSSLAAIDSVPNTVFTYTDSFPPLGSYYAVAAENPNGPCIPTTHRAGLSLLSNAFSNGFNTGVLGLSSLTNNISALKIYPNPSNGMFTLNYTMSGSDNVTISIINELGQQVYTGQRHANNGPVTEQLNVENLASGIYMLRIQTSKGIAVQKLSIMQ